METNTNNTPSSKSQSRLMALVGIAANDSYQASALALEAAGYVRSGIPSGTWRTAAKLTDTQLISASKFVDERRNPDYAGRPDYGL